VERKLCEEIELIQKQEIERAKSEDRVEPDWSNTIEMLLLKVSEVAGLRFSILRLAQGLLIPFWTVYAAFGARFF